MIAVAPALAAWIPTVQGQYINEDWTTGDDGFGAQCWDLAANWSKYLGLPVINTGGTGRWPGWAGNMVDSFPQTPEIAAAYELIGPDQLGMAGDIAVWGDTFWYYPKTHVAVLVAPGGQLLCMSQNSTPSQPGNPYPEWTTGPTTIQHLPVNGLIGYIRPRTGLALQGDITEDDMGFVDGISDEAAKKIAGHFWNFDFEAGKNADGTTRMGKPLWMLQSLDAIIRETIEKTAAATASVILNTQLPNVLTGGSTSLATQVSWLPQDFKAVRDGQDGPDRMSEEDFARLVTSGIDAAVAGLSITLTAHQNPPA